VIPRFLAAAARGIAPTIFGDGEQTRDFTFVADVVRANLLACSAGPDALGRAYNIGRGVRVSLNELVRAIAQLTGRDVRPDHAAPRPGDIRHSLASIDLAARHLAYQPTVGLIEGLRATWQDLGRA
jgi:nucleoside-diphosphate-sugar epimerase